MVSIVDVPAVLAQGGSGVLWSAPPGDLNANVVALVAEQHIDEHRQDEVDVLVVVLSGDGELAVDGESHRVGAQQIVVIPAGARRSIRAGASGVAYLTVHRARGPLQIERAT
jgi:quercetin dioxygenase-like cupin family protein